jgi:hypothetical protein
MGQTSETVEEHGVAKGTLISNQGKYVSNTFILAIISISPTYMESFILDKI